MEMEENGASAASTTRSLRTWLERTMSRAEADALLASTTHDASLFERRKPSVMRMKLRLERTRRVSMVFC